MIPQVTPEQAAETLRRNPDAAYLDVRSEAEFRSGHPRGAYNVPVVFFDAAQHPRRNADFERVVQATFPPDTILLVGCQSGVRSQHAAEILRSLGYREVSNVAGGFGGSAAARGWRDSGLPVENGDSPERSYAKLQQRSV
jgi:rhodanese-related sulfurtransferase